MMGEGKGKERGGRGTWSEDGDSWFFHVRAWRMVSKALVWKHVLFVVLMGKWRDNLRPASAYKEQIPRGKGTSHISKTSPRFLYIAMIKFFLALSVPLTIGSRTCTSCIPDSYRHIPK